MIMSRASAGTGTWSTWQYLPKAVIKGTILHAEILRSSLLGYLPQRQRERATSNLLALRDIPVAVFMLLDTSVAKSGGRIGIHARAQRHSRTCSRCSWTRLYRHASQAQASQLEPLRSICLPVPRLRTELASRLGSDPTAFFETEIARPGPALVLMAGPPRQERRADDTHRHSGCDPHPALN